METSHWENWIVGSAIHFSQTHYLVLHTFPTKCVAAVAVANIQNHTHCSTTYQFKNRVHVHKTAYMIMYRLWRMVSVVPFVTAIKLNDSHDNIKWSWINSLEYHYSSTLWQSTLMHVSHLGTVFVFFVKENPTFCLVNSIFPVFHWCLSGNIHFLALTLLAPVSHTLTTTISPALWQASRTPTRISPLVLHESSNKLVVAATFHIDHGAWKPGHDLQCSLSCHGS